MMIQDIVFGPLEYDGFWFKDMKISFGGIEQNIWLSISGEMNGKFDDEQYTAYSKCMQDWDEIQLKLIQAILDYYIKRRSELGYEDGSNENYPLICSTNHLLEHIILVGINIPYAGGFHKREVGITFDCSWDDENGIGLVLVNEEVVKVGYQDITM